MKMNVFLLIPMLLLGFSQCNNSDDPVDTGKKPDGGTYIPGDPAEVQGDVMVKVLSGEASQFQNGENIEKSWDGNMNTLYHSPYYGTKFPVTLEYRFKEPENIDYIVPKPRTGGGNGAFGAFELFVATESSPEYASLGKFDFNFSGSPIPIFLGKTIEGVTAFKFSVESGENNFVSCAEMEFWRYGEGSDVEAFKDIFKDDVLSELADGATREKIEKMNNSFFKGIALALLDGKYEKEFRVQEYEPYPTIHETATALKISGYCPFENATGMYFPSLSDVIIVVGDTGGESLSLQIHNFGTHSDETFFLKPGINKFTTKTNGLGYISYFTKNWKAAKKVKIHITTGKVNGYIDVNKHTSADWKRLIDGAVSSYFDLKGNYVNLAYTTNELRTYCADGWKLIKQYDDFITIQHDLMGLLKYDKRPKNHMFARTTESGLFADGWGAGFYRESMEELADLDKCKTYGVWAIAHEFGHVNQIRPGLKWVSTTEVTNNVYSIVTRHKYWPENVNLEHEDCLDGDGNSIIGGRFTSYLNYGVVRGEQWLCQRGQDKMEGYENGGDHFVKLCPLWQLLLYYRVAEGTPWQKKDWYGDVAEVVRNTDESRLSNGTLQLNFMRNTMDATKQDLTDFFQKCGMLKPIDKNLDDYSRGDLKITQADCDAMIEYGKKYPKPASPVIYYITANSLKAYEKQLSVTGTFGDGISVRENPTERTKDYNMIVDNMKWKNVTVFETYKNDVLTYVTMVGTGSETSDRNTTLLRYPPGSTRIEAVSWNGERTLVYGTR